MWAYSLGEYLYALSRQGLTLKHKTYSIAQEEDDFLEWEGHSRKGAVFGIWVVEKEEGKDKLEGSFLLLLSLDLLLGTVGGEFMKKIFGGRRRCKRVRYV